MTNFWPTTTCRHAELNVSAGLRFVFDASFSCLFVCLFVCWLLLLLLLCVGCGFLMASS